MTITKILLGISFMNLHIEGGIYFTIPLLILMITNIIIIGYVVVATLQKNQINGIWLESIPRIGRLASAWGMFSTLFGFLQASDAIEHSPEPIPFPVICGGVKVALIAVLYGLLINCGSYLAYIIIKMMRRKLAI